jgi:DNA-binding transcriptional regulator YhcF (GntR family)
VDEPFVMVPTRLLLDPRLSSVAVHAYGLIFRHERKRKDPYPGRKLLAAEIGCSLDTIDRALRLLLDTGWVTVERRAGKPHVFHRGEGIVAVRAEARGGTR